MWLTTSKSQCIYCVTKEVIMQKLKTNFMHQHPLRQSLKKKDWKRIQSVMDGDLSDDNATEEELNAAHDVLYDAIAGHEQTHLGVTTLQ